MDEEDYLVPYKDITELKKELEEIQGKKDVSIKDIHEAVVKLAHALTDMLEVFGAATEQMKFEESEYQANTRKHEMIISKLDKLFDQNKTIAEGMVAIVEVVKEKLGAEREESFFKPKPEPKPFMKPQTEWQPRPEPMMPRPQPMMAPQMRAPQMAPPAAPPALQADFGMQMPPMQPEPSPELSDLDFPEETFGLEETKKKGIFGMFKK